MAGKGCEPFSAPETAGTLIGSHKEGEAMDSEGFLPRISVPDEEDISTVATALTEYVHAVARRGMMTGDLRTMVDEVRRAGALLDALITDMENRTVAGLFGSDEEFRENVEKLAEEYGNEGDV